MAFRALLLLACSLMCAPTLAQQLRTKVAGISDPRSREIECVMRVLSKAKIEAIASTGHAVCIYVNEASYARARILVDKAIVKYKLKKTTAL